jgi:hypothetical protein
MNDFLQNHSPVKPVTITPITADTPREGGLETLGDSVSECQPEPPETHCANETPPSNNPSLPEVELVQPEATPEALEDQANHISLNDNEFLQPIGIVTEPPLTDFQAEDVVLDQTIYQEEETPNPVMGPVEESVAPVEEPTEQFDTPVEGHVEEVITPVDDHMEEAIAPVEDCMEEVVAPAEDPIGRITPPVEELFIHEANSSEPPNPGPILDVPVETAPQKQSKAPSKNGTKKIVDSERDRYRKKLNKGLDAKHEKYSKRSVYYLVKRFFDFLSLIPS